MTFNAIVDFPAMSTYHAVSLIQRDAYHDIDDDVRWRRRPVYGVYVAMSQMKNLTRRRCMSKPAMRKQDVSHQVYDVAATHVRDIRANHGFGATWAYTGLRVSRALGQWYVCTATEAQFNGMVI